MGSPIDNELLKKKRQNRKPKTTDEFVEERVASSGFSKNILQCEDGLSPQLTKSKFQKEILE